MNSPKMFVRELHDQNLVRCCRVDPTIFDQTLVGIGSCLGWDSSRFHAYRESEVISLSLTQSEPAITCKHPKNHILCHGSIDGV